jgi:hypothetical protein
VEKTQNRCLFVRRSGRGARMSAVLFPRKEDSLLRFRRYHLATVLAASMMSGLAMLLRSHGGGDRAP